MPGWAQVSIRFNLIVYFIEDNQLLFIKGSGGSDIAEHLAIILDIGLFISFVAVLQYQKINA